MGWVCEVTDELVGPSVSANVVIRCPKCKVEQIDYDGFGFVYCESCKLCTHPSRTGGVCMICGDKEPPDGDVQAEDGRRDSGR